MLKIKRLDDGRYEVRVLGTDKRRIFGLSASDQRRYIEFIEANRALGMQRSTHGKLIRSQVGVDYTIGG